MKVLGIVLPTMSNSGPAATARLQRHRKVTSGIALEPGQNCNRIFMLQE